MRLPSPSRIAVALLLLSSLLLGLAQVALLPPFEGFDEHGHFSYVQQVAETGRWPRLNDRMSKDVDDYLAVAPGPDSIPRRFSHHAFFAAGGDAVAAARSFVQSPRPNARGFVPGQIENWQAQHPPLYYYLLAPVYHASKAWSLAGQLFALRAASYTLAWTGLGIVAAAALRGSMPGRGAAPALIGAAAWPLLFPMWFPEMGRLGNDSLVTLLTALLFILAWRVSADGRLRDFALLGVVLGLGLVTKATLLPVAAAILLVLAARALRAGTDDKRTARLIGPAIAIAILGVVGGWWYLHKLLETGSIIGSSDVVRMQAGGGLIAGLAANLRLDHVMLVPWGFALTFLWSGTWSFVVPPRVFYIPLLALVLALGYGACRVMRRRGVHPVDAFALLTAILFLGALTYHSAVALSTASGTSPAWYLHSLAPILGLLAGYGICALMQLARTRALFAALMLYPLLFLPGATLMNALYFAGCAPKLPGRLYFAASQAAQCIADPARIYDNLAVLTLPGFGIALFAAGWVAGLAGLALALRSLAAAADVSAAAARRNGATAPPRRAA